MQCLEKPSFLIGLSGSSSVSELEIRHKIPKVAENADTIIERTFSHVLEKKMYFTVQSDRNIACLTCNELAPGVCKHGGQVGAQECWIRMVGGEMIAGLAVVFVVQL